MTMGYIEAPVDPPDYWVCEESAKQGARRR